MSRKVVRIYGDAESSDFTRWERFTIWWECTFIVAYEMVGDALLKWLRRHD